MRNITIDFTAENTVSDLLLGKMGEHNAATITFTPPASLTEDERTDHYRAAFASGGRTVLSEAFSEVPFSVPLWAQLTAFPRMSIQIIAYAADGAFIGKSDKLSGFYFEASVSGTAVETDGSNHDIAHEVKRLRDNYPEKTSDLTNDGEGNGAFITSEDIPEALPNPHGLIINGTAYDGSSEVSVTVQGGGDAPVRTSELENDGEDGEHPFITAEELSEAVSVKETSMEARIAAAELAGHHAENVPIVVLDDWARTLAFAFDNDYQHAHNDVLPNGSRLLKCVISDGTNSSELNEIPFCHGTNLLADSNFLKIVGFAVYDENGLFSNQTWLGQAYNMGLEEFTAEIWWEE